MAVKCEVGMWTADFSDNQLVLAAGSGFGTVQAIILVTHGGTSLGGATSVVNSYGFGTRRGGSTQQFCANFWSEDNVDPSDTGRRYRTDAIINMIATIDGANAVTMSLSGMGAGTVDFTEVLNFLNGHKIGYIAFSGFDDAIVLTPTLGTGGTTAVTGAGFQPNAVFAIHTAQAAANTLDTHAHLSFGFATSSTRFRGITHTAEDAVTSMASNYNNNRSFRSDAFIERLNLTADTTDARWDLDSFDSDGLTLGAVDTPTAGDQEVGLLLLKGGSWDCGHTASGTGSGVITYTINEAWKPQLVILASSDRTAVGIASGTSKHTIGAADGTNQWYIGGITLEALPSDATPRLNNDACMIEWDSAGLIDAQASWSAFNNGNFQLNWASAPTASELDAWLVLKEDLVPNPPLTTQPKIHSDAVRHSFSW